MTLKSPHSPPERGLATRAELHATPPPTSLGHIWLVFLGIALGTLAIEHLGRALNLSEYTHAALAALFLVTAVQGAERNPGGLQGHGMSLGGLLDPPRAPAPGWLGDLSDFVRSLRHAAPLALREAGVALAIAAITFPPFVAAFYVLVQPQQRFAFQPMAEPLDYILSQLLVVALPEEALFRGYLQTRLRARFAARHRLLGIAMSWPALLLQAGLFAVLHFLVTPRFPRLAVFFPALLFGWIREARGGIGAALVYHALCNILADILARGFV